MRNQENMNMIRNHIAGLSLKADDSSNRFKHLTSSNDYTVVNFLENILDMNEDDIYEIYENLNCYGQQEFENIISEVISFDEQELNESFMSGMRSGYAASKNAGISREKNVKVRQLMSQPVSKQMKAAFQNRVSTPIGKKVGKAGANIRNKISSIISNFATRTKTNNTKKSAKSKPKAKQPVSKQQSSAPTTPQAASTPSKPKINRRATTVKNAVNKIKAAQQGQKVQGQTTQGKKP